MSNIEHLMENALTILTKAHNDFWDIPFKNKEEADEFWNKAYNTYSQDKDNQYMAKESDINLQTVWDCACYVIFTWRDFDGD